jgi:hypothetical protein
MPDREMGLTHTSFEQQVNAGDLQMVAMAASAQRRFATFNGYLRWSARVGPVQLIAFFTLVKSGVEDFHASL